MYRSRAVHGPARGAARLVTAVQLADIEEVPAYHGDNYEVLVHRFFKADRAVIFDLAA
jgi:hypothetical protein